MVDGFNALFLRAYEPWAGASVEALDALALLVGVLAAVLLLFGLRRCCPRCYKDVEKTPLLPTSALRSDQTPKRGRKNKTGAGSTRAGGTSRSGGGGGSGSPTPRGTIVFGEWRGDAKESKLPSGRPLMEEEEAKGWMARAASAGDSNALILLAKRVFAGGGDPHDSEHLISSAGGSRAGRSKPAPTKDEQKRAYIIEALRLARDASQADHRTARETHWLPPPPPPPKKRTWTTEELVGRGDEEEEGRQLGRQELLDPSLGPLPEAVTVAATRVAVADREAARYARATPAKRAAVSRAAERVRKERAHQTGKLMQQAAAAEQKAAELTAAQKAGWKARQEEAIAEAIRQRHMH